MFEVTIATHVAMPGSTDDRLLADALRAGRARAAVGLERFGVDWGQSGRS